MQKVLDFLERHVQWVAIAIAAVFLLYALSMYLPVVAEPVTLTLANEPLGPGEVDPVIRENADNLQSRIDTPVKVAIKVPDQAARIRQAMEAPSETKPLPPTLLYARPVEYPEGLAWGTPAGGGGTSVSSKVNALPTLPAAILEPEASTGFAQVTVGPPTGAPGAPPPPPARAAPPPTAGMPGAPAGTAAPIGSAAPANASDTTWVRVPFSVPAGNIARAFSEVNLPTNLTSTSFLRVELVRQKQLPGDEWAGEEVVDVLPTLQMPPLPPEGPEHLPAQQQYTGWANANQGPIVQPEFFPVVAGSDPRLLKPVDPNAPVDGAPAVFDPETFPPAGMPGGDISTLTPEQQAQVRAVRQRRAKEAQEARPGPPGGMPGGQGGPGGPGGRRGGREPGMDGGFSNPASNAPSAATGIVPFQQRPPGPQDPGFDPIIGDGMGGMGVDGMMPGMPGMPPQPGQPIVVAPLPPAPFDPSQVPGGLIQGWAYDVTAAADSTYRYRVRYRLKNPIFGVQNVANRNELIGVFSLIGEDAKVWSPPLTIAPLTHVYLSALPQPGSNRVAVTVFRWQAGKRHRANMFVGPGDSIGKLEGDVDYRTKWTLVEVRRDTSSSSAYALLMNADGMLRKLDFDADKATPLFQQLNVEVDGPAVPGAPGAPGMPGGPPRPGMPGAPPRPGMPGGPPPGYPGGPARGGP